MPARRASWLRRLAIAAAAAVALLAGVVALFPLFVDGDRVRHAIERRISALAGGEVRYDSLKLRFFPRPYVEAHNATVRIPGTLDGRIGTLVPLFDQAVQQHPVDRPVERTRPERLAGSVADLGQDRVSVPIAAGQCDEDLKHDRGERQERFRRRIASRHWSPRVYIP